MLEQSTIMVVDDDHAMTKTLMKILAAAGYDMVAAQSADVALAIMHQRCPDLVITDLRLNGMSGDDLQAEIARRIPGVPVVIITAFGSIESAVESMRRGAFDFITKPFTNSQLKLVVERALEDRELRRGVQRLRGELARSYGVENVIIGCPQMEAVLEIVRRVADSDASVLLTGESGTGKDLLARLLHFRSHRAQAPFIHINCAAIPDNLLESELFGHLKGSFTDARQNKLGLFQAADRGTLFLDELDQMPNGLQAKLLTAIESKRVRPVGATTEVGVDVRIVAATNIDLERAMADGSFRRDLYYRLSALTLHVPPLRERREAIPYFVEAFLTRAAAENGRPVPEITSEASDRLLQYSWPGNVRELQNALQHAVLLCRNNRIFPADLPAKIGGLEFNHLSTNRHLARRRTLQELEHDYIHSVLASVGGNKGEAAAILGIDRKTLYRKLGAHARPFHGEGAGRRPPVNEPVGSQLQAESDAWQMSYLDDIDKEASHE
jgi:two-component system, NtrC family, response regulator HydG